VVGRFGLWRWWWWVVLLWVVISRGQDWVGGDDDLGVVAEMRDKTDREIKR